MTRIESKLSEASVAHILANDNVLAVIDFNDQCTASGLSRYITSGLPTIHQPELKEVWYSDQPVKHGIDNGLYWASAGDLLIAGLWIKDTEQVSLSSAIEQGYRRLLEFTKKTGFLYMVRAWNYVSDINAGKGDQERYKQFCLGRHNAFTHAGYNSRDFPAATVVGHKSEEAVIYMFASKEPCRHFENPQQTSAYQYPRIYGPQSPSFARATFYGDTENGLVCLSGTASIIGHATQRKGDVEGQVSVSLDNLEKLMDSIAEQIVVKKPAPPNILKVYIRNPEQLDAVNKVIRKHFDEQTQVAYLRADICRADLLVEIEAVYHL